MTARVAGGRLTISGIVHGGSAYLGCTLRGSRGERDFPAAQVRGSFDRGFDYGGFEGGQYVVRLWAQKVHNCGCAYCRKSGYHLEGELDRSTGRLPDAGLGRQTVERLQAATAKLASALRELPANMKEWRERDLALYRQARKDFQVIEDIVAISSGRIDRGTLSAAKRTIERWNEFDRRVTPHLEAVKARLGSVARDPFGTARSAAEQARDRFFGGGKRFLVMDRKRNPLPRIAYCLLDRADGSVVKTGRSDAHGVILLSGLRQGKSYRIYVNRKRDGSVDSEDFSSRSYRFDGVEADPVDVFLFSSD